MTNLVKRGANELDCTLVMLVGQGTLAELAPNSMHQPFVGQPNVAGSLDLKGDSPVETKVSSVVAQAQT